MLKVLLLSILLFYICWSTYNLCINEGFQTAIGSPSGVPDQSKCEILALSYKSLAERYNKALENNNKSISDSILQGIDIMKISLRSMNCEIPNI